MRNTSTSGTLLCAGHMVGAQEVLTKCVQCLPPECISKVMPQRANTGGGRGRERGREGGGVSALGCTMEPQPGAFQLDGL